jgi:hypothetical protein
LSNFQSELEHPVPDLDPDVAEAIKNTPEISGRQVYYIAVCENHLLNESFVLKSYRTKMPKHWREEKVRCNHSNCYNDSTEWLIVDLSEATFKGREK